MRKTRKETRGSVTFYWDNPPGPEQGCTIERLVRGHMYTRRVGPRGALSPSEAALALRVRREFIYQLIRAGKLKAVKRQGMTIIPLSSIKAHMQRRRPRKPTTYLDN